MPKLSKELRKLNKERAARGLGVMERYGEYDCGEATNECSWVDLVADILHAIEKQGFDPEGTLTDAMRHYHAEIKGD